MRWWWMAGRRLHEGQKKRAAEEGGKKGGFVYHVRIVLRAKDLNLLGPMCVSSLYLALLWVRGPAWRTKLVHFVGARQRACGLHSHSSGLLNRGVVSYEVLGTDDIASTS